MIVRSAPPSARQQHVRPWNPRVNQPQPLCDPCLKYIVALACPEHQQVDAPPREKQTVHLLVDGLPPEVPHVHSKLVALHWLPPLDHVDAHRPLVLVNHIHPTVLALERPLHARLPG